MYKSFVGLGFKNEKALQDFLIKNVEGLQSISDIQKPLFKDTDEFIDIEVDDEFYQLFLARGASKRIYIIETTGGY